MRLWLAEIKKSKAVSEWFFVYNYVILPFDPQNSYKKIPKHSPSSIMEVKTFPIFSSSHPQYLPKHAPLTLQLNSSSWLCSNKLDNNFESQTITASDKNDFHSHTSKLWMSHNLYIWSYISIYNVGKTLGKIIVNNLMDDHMMDNLCSKNPIILYDKWMQFQN